jgi:helicase SWR1
MSKAKLSRASWNSSSPQTPMSSKSGMNGRCFVGGKMMSNGTGVISPRRESPRSPTLRNASARQLGLQSQLPKHTPSGNRTKSLGPTIVHTKSTRLIPNGDSPQHARLNSVASVAAPPAVTTNMHNDEKDQWVQTGNGTEGSPRKLPRLRFKVKMPSLGAQNPHHLLPLRKYSSFREWVENDATKEEDGSFTTGQAALQEARMRERVREAGEPGNLLSKDRCSYYIADPEEEPPPQYSHQDHLVAHALYFKKLLDKEHKHHRNLAKLFAQWCAEVWRKRNKRPEDILREQQEEMRQKHRQVYKDLQRLFDLVRAEVERVRLARWEEEKKMEDQAALNKAIKQSTLLFEKRRPDRTGEVGMDEDGQSKDETGSGTDGSSEGEGAENESNMSTFDSESEGDNDGLDDDEDLTAEELRAKYAHLVTHNPIESPLDHVFQEGVSSSVRSDTPNPEFRPDNEIRSPSVTGNTMTGDGKLDEVDPLLLDDSDESTDMDDDMGDSDEDSVSTDGDAGNSSESKPGLLGFFSAKELGAVEDTTTREEEQTQLQGDDVSDDDEVLLVPNGPLGQNDSVVKSDEPSPARDVGEVADHIQPSREASSQASPRTFATKLSEVESASSYEPHGENAIESPRSPEPSLGLKTQIPHLLRGTLREYQHFGLDWLAGLYANKINGILADEMGLGKTIQTIALLAHLAVEHEVWGPHLIVVPTSVMLNWEMEFKKWCPGFKILTYYGTQEERKQKRKGWMDDDRWNVCITSYQLVLQDQQTFKRRNWHYMVLDEAHNIKNFRSQRWQTLLTFKTQARLLLTGTPLQNNLTELWSLLFFLMPSDGSDVGAEGFADLKDFSEWFRRPVEQILEHGRDTMDDEAKRVVSKLHTVLRPYILRRLKVDVEKQMPAKFEHVVSCRLSKRQRYLYDGFMSRAQTKETLASGNYLSIINCLMQLRKVCNHPDLFETRPITTSFAMRKSVIADFEIKELLVRKRLLQKDPLSNLDLDFLNLVPISREQTSRRLVDDSTRIMAYGPLRVLRERQYNRTNWLMDFDGSSVQSILTSMENAARKARMEELERCLYFESKRHGRRPIYGESLIDLLTMNRHIQPVPVRLARRHLVEWLSNQSPAVSSMILSLDKRSAMMEPFVQKFACITPAVFASGMTEAALAPVKSRSLTAAQRTPSYDPFHEAQMRLSIAFPDKRLLQYDCGKLQQLEKLLRKLQAGGHRALIFTQMTKMLDILEQFLNIHGHRYLRLDGATKVEQRQILTERFNNDTRILVFILSSRSGGLGINLTGADTVIFYDLDWNPAMDKQCQDRCHRIGQTRDVHIYRFVSEYTIESNILRKANQKRMLDDVVIQEGEFTTDYFNKLDVRDMLGDDLLEGHDEASAAMDRVLDTRVGGTPRVFEQAEDKEDIDAAKNAEKELEHADDGDFDESSVPHTPGQIGISQAGTPMTTGTGEDEGSGMQNTHLSTRHTSPSVLVTDNQTEADTQFGHIDDYLLRFMEWNMRDEPLLLPPDKCKKRPKKGQEHRVKRHR